MYDAGLPDWRRPSDQLVAISRGGGLKDLQPTTSLPNTSPSIPYHGDLSAPGRERCPTLRVATEQDPKLTAVNRSGLSRQGKRKIYGISGRRRSTGALEL